MSFLNWIMLGGVAALSIPLLIHLFNRSRFRVVEWGAMHLLQSVVRVNRKRVRLEQIILLLVRCAIPAVLALLMARPVITGWRALSGDTPGSTVVLLDNSYSMQAGDAAGTRFAAAVEETSQLLQGLKRGSDVSVVLTGGSPEPVFDRPAFDVPGLIEQVRLLEAGYGPAATAPSIEAGAAILARMSHAKRDLIIVSDFQKRNWESVDAAERTRLRELLAHLDPPATLTFLHVEQTAAIDNIAVESIEFSRQTVGVGQTLRVRANLRNHGTKAYQNLRVYCRVNGREHAASQIALGGGEATQVLFTIEFESGGSHLIEIEADAPDLKADNTFLAAVNVLERLPVLLVDGDPAKRGQPLSGDTDFLAVALQPFASMGPAAAQAKLADLIQTQTVTAADLKPEHLSGKRAVVLANVPKLADAQLAAVRQFVTGGGGLAVFPGNRIDMAWYNKVLADPAAGLLPMRYDALIDTAQGLPAASIVQQHYQHPALSVFNDAAQGSLADAEIRTWYRLAAQGDTRNVLARLETGDPLMAERHVGQGAVIQFATAADADWSNLPMRPFYLPLLQQVMTYLAVNVEPPRNIQAGKALVAMVPADAASGAAEIRLTTPQGAQVRLQPIQKQGRQVIEFAGTRRPGAYTLRVGDGRPTHFVATADRSESQLEPLSRDEIAKIADGMNAAVATSAAGYAELDAQRRHGREIWKLLLMALLLLVFGELLLEAFFGRAAGRSA